MKIDHLLKAMALAIFLALAPQIVAAPQQSTPSSSTQSSAHATAYQFDVDATKQWVDTRLDLKDFRGLASPGWSKVARHAWRRPANVEMQYLKNL